MDRLLAIREKFAHTSIKSGYDVLYQHLESKLAIDSIFCKFNKPSVRGVGRILTYLARLSHGSSFYNSQSLLTELKVWLKKTSNTYDYIHYSYGEPYFNLSHLFPHQNKKIILTNHQPLSFFDRNQHMIKKFEAANSIIVLSAHDKEYYDSIFRTKTHYIPHGVDIDFFRPDSSQIADRNISFKVVFSGRYLRDLDTLAEVIRKLSATSMKFTFEIIYQEKRFVNNEALKSVMDYENVNWHSDVSEMAYLNILQSAHCCLIPLLECTANNAILESMACGLPIVATALPAIQSYVDDLMGILKHSADDLCDALILLYENENLRIEMGNFSRQKAVNYFDWAIIARDTLNVYRT